MSLNEENELQRCRGLVAKLKQGACIALVSDAGTPLISDPGYRLVGAVQNAGLGIRAVPGASSVTAALSICGLPIHRFVFEGFLSSRTAARRSRLIDLKFEERTLVFFESPRRLLAVLSDMRLAFGDHRRATLVREISKRFEAVIAGTLIELEERAHLDSALRKGELVIVVEGSDNSSAEFTVNSLDLVSILSQYLSPRDASSVAARLTGGRKSEFYRLILDNLRCEKT